MTYLDTLRAIVELAITRSTFSKVDADLSDEAGMDGNLARLLQAARDLDKPVRAPSIYTFDVTLYATVNVVATSYEDAEQLVNDMFTDAVIDLVVREGDPDNADNGRVVLLDCDLCADPDEAPRLRAVTDGNGPNNL